VSHIRERLENKDLSPVSQDISYQDLSPLRFNRNNLISFEEPSGKKLEFEEEKC